MSKYYCVLCDYDAKQKSNYVKHMKTKKHMTCLSESQSKVIQSYPKLSKMLSKVIHFYSFVDIYK